MSPADHYDVIVIGAGHAGAEAALAAARLGRTTLILTLDAGAVGRMSCNPAIGGLAKGHLVREIDALGGEMGRAIDATGTHFKMLNRSRGPAVQGPRAQADRDGYCRYMCDVVERESNIDLLQGEVADLVVRGDRVTGVTTTAGDSISAGAVILTAGTFLSARMFVGEQELAGGRLGEPAAERLSTRMRTLGFHTARLKTGTPPRISAASVDWSNTIEQKPDESPVPFSFATDLIDRPQLSCWITKTGVATAEAIRGALHRSPLHTGRIEGAGPRYCPSIEDKVVRFSHHPSHHVFLEIEGGDSDLVYPNGLSTSLPKEAQVEFLRTVPGLEDCVMVVPGYAVEYDFFPTDQIGQSLESRPLRRLYLAGQMNGTSGYEEAAAQGLIAGINAARQLAGEEPVVLDRSEAYIGVLIDDLVTRIPREPYRMFTSRAEYRLLLRHDTADFRLAARGVQIGLQDPEIAAKAERRDRAASREVRYLQQSAAPREAAAALIAEKGGAPVRPGTKLDMVLKRPGIVYDDIVPLRDGEPLPPPEVRREAETRIKYSGYVERQIRDVTKMAAMEHRRIPADIMAGNIHGFSREGREKLLLHRPETVGVASRIEGVTPADLSLLVVLLDRLDRSGEIEGAP